MQKNCRQCANKFEVTDEDLYARECAKCATQIQTSYSPDRPEIVYCEQCYLKEVY